MSSCQPQFGSAEEFQLSSKEFAAALQPTLLFDIKQINFSTEMVPRPLYLIIVICPCLHICVLQLAM